MVKRQEGDVSKFYSANLSQNIVPGMRESASRGFFPSGPPPYGYVRVKVEESSVQRVKLEPDPATAPVVERKIAQGHVFTSIIWYIT